MSPKKDGRPSQSQLILPLAELIREEGALKAKHAAEALAERLDLDRAVTEEVVRTPKGQRVAVWRRHVRYAGQKAKVHGLVSFDDGVWRSGEKSSERLKQAVPTLVVTVGVDELGSPRCVRVDVGAAIPTRHELVQADSRNMGFIENNAIGLVVTSAPYADLIAYEGGGDAQLGGIQSYEAFLEELDRVWTECARVLTPGGRMAVVVGDVLRSRRLHGRHHVLPLAADITVRARRIGFDALTPIIWRKRSNVSYEGGGRGRLGKPGMPNQVIQAESETILLLRKPGGYRSPEQWQREASRLSPDEERAWLTQHWTDLPGQRRVQGGHPAPYPVELARRLVKLFSFAGDCVLDPFSGSMTTTIAALQSGRSSVGVEVSERYFRLGVERVEEAARRLIAA